MTEAYIKQLNMKKLLLFIMTMLIASIPTHAAVGDEFEIDGLKYAVTSEGNPATVSVTGYTGEPTTVNIPEAVTFQDQEYTVVEIHSQAFMYCPSLTDVTIPYSVRIIGKMAFTGTPITNVIIGESVEFIGDSAFEGCKNLTKISIPNSVETIGKMGFSGCNSLKEIDFGENLNLIDVAAFIGCSSLTKIDFGDNFTNILQAAFEDCTSLTEVRIGKSGATIDDEAFASCESLTDFIMEGPVVMHDDPFNKCTNLKKLDFPEGSSLRGSALAGSSVTEISMKNPKDIFDGAFIGCYTLETINVEGSGYISIDGVLFLNGALLIQYPAGKKNETYEVPIHVAEISEYAFFGCKNLKKLTLTPHVKEIRLSTFNNCSSLEEIYAFPFDVPTCPEFKGCSDNMTLYVPFGMEDKYDNSDWDYRVGSIRGIPTLEIPQIISKELHFGETFLIEPDIVINPEFPFLHGLTTEVKEWYFDTLPENTEVITIEDNGVVTAKNEGRAIGEYMLIDEYGGEYYGGFDITVTNEAGVDSIGSDENNAPAEYYNMNGIRVNPKSLTPGIYIKRQGNKSYKIVIPE